MKASELGLSEHLDRAKELVYEAITGECIHKCNKGKIPLIPDVSYSCAKCGESSYSIRVLPDLANSLDAWRPLWERMLKRPLEKPDIIAPYQEHLFNRKHDTRVNVGSAAVTCALFAQPIHHLEAALRAIEVECECSIQGVPGLCASECDTLPACKSCDKDPDATDCTPEITCPLCNKGMITLWDKLEREVR